MGATTSSPRYRITLEIEPRSAHDHADAREVARQAADAIDGLELLGNPLAEVKWLVIERVAPRADGGVGDRSRGA